MRTIGEILTSARLDKNLSLEDIAKATKIELKYIEALENDRFDLLPPATFVKGFIRNIAKVLGKPADDLVAIYRRDAQQVKPATLTPLSTPTPAFGHLFQRSFLLPVLFGLAFFLSYLGFQYRALLVPPPLTLTQPADKAVLTSPVTISGSTSSDSLITINFTSPGSPDQTTDVKPDGSGEFLTQISLSPGDHSLAVTATNRFGRSASKTVPLTVISSD